MNTICAECQEVVEVPEHLNDGDTLDCPHCGNPVRVRITAPPDPFMQEGDEFTPHWTEIKSDKQKPSVGKGVLGIIAIISIIVGVCTLPFGLIFMCLGGILWLMVSKS